MDAARALQQARHAAGLTQAGLASRAGTSQAAISAYESGRKLPSLPTLSRLLAATGARLSVTRAESARVAVSEAALKRAGEQFGQVLALAEALPVRHTQDLRYPRLGR